MIATNYTKCSKRILAVLQHLELHLPPPLPPSPSPLPSHSLNQIHAHLVVSGAISDPFAAGKLISLFSSSDDLRHADLILYSLPRPAVYLYNTLLRAHVDRRRPSAALVLYRRMLAAPRLPNNYTFSFLIRACVDLPSIIYGRQIHAHCVHLGWESYDFVQNGLIHMYSDFDMIDSARKLFNESCDRDVITWTAMVHGYAKARQIAVARELFDKMPVRNVVSWSSMITASSQVGMFKEALELFHEMQATGTRPNHAGIVGALSACGFLGALDQGRWIHAFIERTNMQIDPILGTALIDMYAKCGCIEISTQVFDVMPKRDVFAFTSMISGLSNHGKSSDAVNLFDRMKEENVWPNEVTFICLLSACARMGLVEKGRELFVSMRERYGIAPKVEHYGCLIDLLARAGLIEEAKNVVLEMPMVPDSYVLGALLNACGEHSKMNLGKEVARSLEELGCDHSGVQVLMSNMYASAYRWDDVSKVREGMEAKEVVKVPGCSMIEVDGVVCEFTAGSKSHQLLIDVIKEIDRQVQTIGACYMYSREFEYET